MKKWINKILILLKLNKESIWTPSDYELKILESAYLKKFSPTIECLKRLLKGGTYKVKLTFKKLDDQVSTNQYTVTLAPDKISGFKFKIIMPRMPNVPSVKYKESYGLTNELKLFNKKTEYYIPKDSVSDFETKFPSKPQILEGKFINIKSSKNPPKNSYFRLFIPIKEKEFIYPTNILDFGENHMRFDISSWDRQTSLIGIPFLSTKGMYSELSINKYSFHFYGIEQINSIIIDSLEPISMELFKQITNSIRLSFAFLSGKYYKEEVVYFGSKKSDFSLIDFYEYQLEGPSLITINQIINPTFFFDEYQRMENKIQEQWKEFHKMFDNRIFSKICEKVLASPEFARCIDLIVNAGNINDPVQKGALYSVSIETLTELIKDENEDNFNPIPKEKKNVWNQLYTESIKSLENIKNEISEKSYSILKSKIENLNSPTNRDKLEKPFKLLGIELTEDEINTLNNRNDYLHGGQPYFSGWLTLSSLNALKLHSLIGMLILRYFDYHGHYFNIDGWYLLHDIETNEIINNFDFEKLKNILIKLENKDFKNKEEIADAKDYLSKYEKLIVTASTIKGLLRII